MKFRHLPPLTVALQRQYWDIVQDCLVTLHGWEPERAKRAAADLYERVAALPDSLSLLLLYHDEPAHVADDLAGQWLDYRELHAEYDAIRARHENANGVGASRPRRRVQAH